VEAALVLVPAVGRKLLEVARDRARR